MPSSGVTMTEKFESPAFAPRVGDRVEFCSDRQTEKGPSAGTVIEVDRKEHTCVIRHSDHPGEEFRWADVKAKYVRFRGPGDTFWMLD